MTACLLAVAGVPPRKRVSASPLGRTCSHWASVLMTRLVCELLFLLGQCVETWHTCEEAHEQVTADGGDIFAAGIMQQCESDPVVHARGHSIARKRDADGLASPDPGIGASGARSKVHVHLVPVTARELDVGRLRESEEVIPDGSEDLEGPEEGAAGTALLLVLGPVSSLALGRAVASAEGSELHVAAVAAVLGGTGLLAVLAVLVLVENIVGDPGVSRRIWERARRGLAHVCLGW